MHEPSPHHGAHPPAVRHMRRPDALLAPARPLGLLLLLVLAGCAGVGAGRAAPERFAPCHPAHCVSSRESGSTQVAPIVHALDAAAAAAHLRCIVGAVPRSRIVVDEADYLQVTVQSRWMRYVDELEFAPLPGRIDVRSASRFGYYDFGVNRARVEDLRRAFAAPCPAGPEGPG